MTQHNSPWLDKANETSNDLKQEGECYTVVDVTLNTTEIHSHMELFLFYTLRGTLRFPKRGNHDDKWDLPEIGKILLYSGFFFSVSLFHQLRTKHLAPRMVLFCNISNICECDSVIWSFAERISPHDCTVAHRWVANPWLSGSPGVTPLPLLPIQARGPRLTWLAWFADPWGSHWTC